MKAIGLRDVKRGMRLRVTVLYYNGVTAVFEGYADKDWEVIPADCYLRGSRGDGLDSDRMWIGGQEITAVELLDNEPATYEASSSDIVAELSVTGEAMCTVRLADLQAAVSVLEAINPFQHRESERWLDRLKDEL